MEIGEPQKIHEIEPLREPVPVKVPDTIPADWPDPIREPERVPALPGKSPSERGT